MGKMTIIDVDLGASIADIISEDVDKMTEETKRAVDDAITEKTRLDNQRTAQTQLRQRKEQQIKEALEAIYQTLLSASAEGSCVSLDELAELAKPAIANTSALVLQLKSYIRKERGNAHVLQRRTKDRKPVYVLIPFNETIREQEESDSQ